MIREVTRKSLKIRESGRSTDFISPSFGFGCLYNCSYCYMKRHKMHGLDYATNTQTILTAINNHVCFTEVKKPNQTHEEYTTYDISCNEDFALHIKYHDWESIFNFFKFHDTAMGSFATKYVNHKLRDYDPEGKIRIRFSLMPQNMSSIHEPGTSKIIDRIQAIDLFIAAGYDVHINFSPVIVYEGWMKDYENLFKLVNKHVNNKDKVKAEVIFLTHNVNKHLTNLTKHKEAEEYLWVPKLQEGKISQYGGNNIRYKRKLKSEMIKMFKGLHSKVIPWNKIRYIF
tara:strand:- start:11484 stop:12338 length:855 start_codon:yes stop_codon:yes gene_type:complete